ncbi:MAG: DNA mismatch repair protein MutS, partial [Lachnospiraceae bacterium]|jgi:DNA mismatch repair ATPase MutS|nr:DNA mismatch repair protein MutS [Lachnospiraceae bacterium]
MHKYLTGHRQDVDLLAGGFGRLEASISIASYRATLGDEWCVPQFHERTQIHVTDLYHPLLQNPVKNTIYTDGGVLLTGSNASGKSTFLKTVALEILLAQTIHTATATSYQAPFVRLLTSMSLRDDLTSGDSYYMAEIKSLKRILDAKKIPGEPVVCLIDEVLRGTNTVERIAASVEILKSLTDGAGICFAATHDIELTRLLQGKYVNYHFEEIIKEGDISFPYLLQKGSASTRNAILLLEIMGYPNEIITEAQELAHTFLQTGKWTSMEE